MAATKTKCEEQQLAFTSASDELEQAKKDDGCERDHNKAKEGKDDKEVVNIDGESEEDKAKAKVGQPIAHGSKRVFTGEVDGAKKP